MKMVSLLEYYPKFLSVFVYQKKLYSSSSNNHSPKFSNPFELGRIIKPVICRIVSDPNDPKLIRMSQITPHLILNQCHN